MVSVTEYEKKSIRVYYAHTTNTEYQKKIDKPDSVRCQIDFVNTIQ